MEMGYVLITLIWIIQHALASVQLKTEWSIKKLKVFFTEEDNA